MAEECTDSSIATSSTTPSSWWDYNSSSLSSWNTSPWHTQNPSSNSSCEEDISISTSFTNISNRSGLTCESTPSLVDHHEHAPSYEFIGEHTPDNNLWTNVIIQGVKENYMDVLSSNQDVGACDYLKKMDTMANSTWDLTNSAANFDKQFNMGFVDTNFVSSEGERLANKLSSFVNNSSIIEPTSLNSSSVDHHYLHTELSHMKHMFNDLTLCPIRTNRISAGLNYNSCYDHDMNVNINDQHRDEIETSRGDLLRRSFSSSSNIGNGYDLFGGLNNKYYHGLSDSSCTNGRNFDDNVMFFRSKLNKPPVDFHASKPSLKSLNLPDCKKQRPHVISTLAKNNGRVHGNSNEGKKKRFEDNSEVVTKKPKHESSMTVSSVKMQAPKMKLGEKITALQQIVSPFGKTDTASVLLEAIGYIKFLQEQVQLISNPYMKANTTKLQDPWGNLDGKDRDVKLDLKSRGLCLVPISCTPQVCRDNTGSDYWTPTYRGCLYR